MRTISIFLNANIPEEISSGKQNYITYKISLVKILRGWVKSNCFPCICSMLASTLYFETMCSRVSSIPT